MTCKFDELDNYFLDDNNFLIARVLLLLFAESIQSEEEAARLDVVIQDISLPNCSDKKYRVSVDDPELCENYGIHSDMIVYYSNDTFLVDIQKSCGDALFAVYTVEYYYDMWGDLKKTVNNQPRIIYKYE